MRHDERCETRTWSAMVAAADARGEEVPEAVRRLAEESPTGGMVHCVAGCAVRAASVERGRELARRFGW